MNSSVLAIATVPLVTGVIGYVTNWTGVLMLFYPVHFKGVRAPWLRKVARMLPYKVRQMPGLMIGGIGWQGIVPSRAAKMGSLAVDSGIAKLGTPSEFFKQLGPEDIAEQIVTSTRGEVRDTVDTILQREQPTLWRGLPAPVRELVYERVEAQLPDIVRNVTNQVAEHIDALVDVKLMVVKRFDPELANRVFLEMGRRELKFIQNFGFFFGFALGIPVAALTYFVDAWWLLPILGVLIGYVTNWVALWMIYEPAEPEQVGPFRLQGLFIRRQPEVSDVYARIVADEILTVSEFGGELLHGPQSDRTRALIESAMRPAIDRALGPARAPVRVAIGSRDYEAIRESFAAEPVDSMMTPLSDPEFSRRQADTMRELIAERMRAMSPHDFGEMLRTATREDEWLLLLHGAVLGLAGGLLHLALFG
ncbi:MAG TPA: hypothetical protein VFI54_19685 [Solirubrobacteraceae bacterium]|nr:hypothetical protein [Solirubrobacteraceae bacterium]